MSVLEKKFKAARKAWRADKEDVALKKAFKKAKAAFEAESSEGTEEKKGSKKKSNKKRKAEPESDEETPKKQKKESKKKVKAEEATVDIDALEKALKKARKAKKADATPANKKAFKAAKQALEQAKSATETKEESEEEAEEEAEEEPKEEPKEEANEGLAGLKKGGWSAEAEPESEASEKLFCGNLSWDVDDDKIREFFKECGTLTDIYWLTNRETGDFKGCGFVTFDSLEASKKAMEYNGADFMGRPLKLDYAQQKPSKGKGSKGKGKGGKGKGSSPGEKPEGCTTVFCGNLSYDIDDDAMKKFATDAGCGEVKAIRWLTDHTSGDFKGVGFVEFWDTADVDKVMLKNGEDLLGRNIRLDYSTPKEKKW